MWNFPDPTFPIIWTTNPSQTSSVVVAQDLKNSVDMLLVFRYIISVIPSFIADLIQANRCRESLAAEKLMLIVDPLSDVTQEKELLHLWLKQYLDSRKLAGSGKVDSKGMIRSEGLAADTYHALAHILLSSRDQEQWAEDTFPDWLDKRNKDLIESLEEQLTLIEHCKRSAPAFGNTLHALYTSHEVGRTVVNFSMYLTKQGKGFIEKQKQGTTKIEELSLKLLQSVANTCALIKKELDEGGWIDKVLGCTLPDAQDGADSGVSPSLVTSLRDLLDENFLEGMGWGGC